MFMFRTSEVWANRAFGLTFGAASGTRRRLDPTGVSAYGAAGYSG